MVPSGYIRLCPVAELEDGVGRGFRLTLPGVPRPLPVAVFKRGSEIHALRDECPHQFEPLSTGACVGRSLVCAYHGWRFDLDTGEYGIAPGHYLDRYATHIGDDGVLYLNPVPLPKPAPRNDGPPHAEPAD